MNFPEVLYTIDIAFAAFVLVFAVIGLWRGASGETASLLSLFVLLGGICFYYPSLTQLASLQWDTLPPLAVQGIVLVILLLSTLLLSFSLNMLFKPVFKRVLGVAMDKVSGIAVGLVRGGLIGISLMTALSLMPSEALYTMLSEKSVVGGWVCSTFTPWLYPRMMELPVFSTEEN